MRRCVNLHLCVPLGLTAILLTIAAAGCGGSGSQPIAPGKTDLGDVHGLVGEINSTAEGSEPERFEACFAEGVEVDHKKYAVYSFRVEVDAEIDGDSATVMVKARKRDGSSPDYTGGLTWKAAKQNGEWKITEAPLP